MMSNVRSKPSRISVARLSEILNVSPATVSRVLNNRPGTGEATRERVLEAVRIYGAPKLKKRQPPPSAEGAESRMKMISFLISPTMKNQLDHGNQFYGRHLLAIQQSAMEMGYATMLDAGQMAERLGAHSLRCIERGDIQGTIAERLPHELVAEISQKIPLVALNRPFFIDRVDSVIPDIRHAVRLQLDYLYSLGHRRIACFRMTDHWQDKIFWNEFQFYGRELGLYQPKSFFQEFPFGYNEQQRGAAEFLDALCMDKDRPTAVLTYDGYAIALWEECLRRGIRVPEELSILGFDDSYSEELYRTFPLTTYRQNFEEMSREAVRILIDRIKTPHLASRRMAVAGNLVVRGSAASWRGV